MSETIEKAVAALNDRLGDASFDAVAKFVLEGAGNIVIDGNGAREGDDAADVTMTATAEVFEQILAGDLNPTAAFMSGKLSIDGDMGQAMKLGGVLA